MGCKCKKKCVCEVCPRGPRGFAGAPGQPGATGPTGELGEIPGLSSVLETGPIFKFEGASFYDNNNVDAIGIGDIVPFRLAGPNDPIVTPDGGATFILPRVGIYRVDWQMAVNEPTPAQLANPPPGGAHVQTTLTTQAVAEGAFVPVPGGRIGRNAPFAQVAGVCVLVETIRDDQPIRIENTGTVPITFVEGPPTNPNERSINIANTVPQRQDATASAANRADQNVPPNGDVVFDSPGTFVNVEHPPAPFTEFEINVAGRYRLVWFVEGASPSPIVFVPYVNGVPLPVTKAVRVQSATQFAISGQQVTTFYEEAITDIVLQVGDLVTLRNITGPTANPDAPVPGTEQVFLTTQVGPNFVFNASFELTLTNL